MIPVRHIKCGGIVLWYLPNSGKSGDQLDPKDVLRMDMNHPKAGSVFKDKCHKCGSIVTGPAQLYRDFDSLKMAS